MKNSKKQEVEAEKANIPYAIFLLLSFIVLAIPLLLYDIFLEKPKNQKYMLFWAIIRTIPGFIVAVKAQALMDYFASPEAAKTFPTWMLEYGNWFFIFLTFYTIFHGFIFYMLMGGTVGSSYGSSSQHPSIDRTVDLLDTKLATMTWGQKMNMIDKFIDKK